MNQAARDLLAQEGIEVVERPLDDDLERAQELVYDAWETDGDARIELATQALEISAECADAYVIIAEAAPSLGQSLEAYALGVRAGERALGHTAFSEDAGHFWGITETRGYMRARAGLAGCLWELGEREAAVAHFAELLHLNPNDNQGVRYFLVDALLVLGRDAEAESILTQSEYSDDTSCEWAYSKALLHFRRQGDSVAARETLADALTRNEHVAGYLTGLKSLPEELPSLVQLGDETEAISYVAERAEAWAGTPGAIDWLREATG